VSCGDVDALREMIATARQITYRTFIQRADSLDVEHCLGYERDRRRGLTMRNDRHVTYYRSKWKGRRCYFFVWSAIEHIFLEEG
jgi:hypothetical protein